MYHDIMVHLHVLYCIYVCYIDYNDVHLPGTYTHVPRSCDTHGRIYSLIQAKIGIYDKGKSFHICIHDKEYTKVKLSWIFLASSLVLSALVFPIFKFKPPK